MKPFLEVTLVSLTPRTCTVFKKYLKKCRQFRCTGFPRNSKLVQLQGKNLVSFRRNLVPDLMKIVFFSKTNRKW